MSKSDERRKAIIADDQPEKAQEATAETVRPSYRYYCEHCTGIAFYSDDKKAPQVPKGHELNCITCLKAVSMPIKQENFIKTS